jgi:uncharacterized protein involved in type VI secretion and phage assembly
MFAPANQTHFSLTLPGVEHDLQVLEFTGHEALSQPFVFEVTLVSQRPDLDLQALLGQPAFFTLDIGSPKLLGPSAAEKHRRRQITIRKTHAAHLDGMVTDVLFPMFHNTPKNKSASFPCALTR